MKTLIFVNPLLPTVTSDHCDFPKSIGINKFAHVILLLVPWVYTGTIGLNIQMRIYQMFLTISPSRLLSCCSNSWQLASSLILSWVSCWISIKEGVGGKEKVKLMQCSKRFYALHVQWINVCTQFMQDTYDSQDWTYVPPVESLPLG